MAISRASSARAALDNSFEELYRGHRRDVYRAVLRDVGNPDDAEDVTQAAFLDAYRAVLRGSQPQSPRAWLLAIAENVRRRRFRTSQRRPREEPLDGDLPVAAEPPHELARALAEALASLPEEQRRVFLLREFADLSYDEIAERLHATVASVQMLLFRARRSLRAQLEPPTVSERRSGLLVPVPGWLATFVSRVEVVGLAPRAAGAVGAAVLTVVGANVVAGGSEAGARPTPSVAAAAAPSALQQRASTTPTRRIARAGVSGLSASAPAALLLAGRIPAAAKPAAPVANDASPTAPTTAAAPTVATTTSAETDPRAPAAAVVPVVERPPSVPLPKLDEPIAVPVPAVPVPSAPVPSVPSVSVPSVAVPSVPSAPVPSVPVPSAPSVPVPAVPAVTDAVTTGAAGAAGAGAPPLPVSALPLDTLPPAP